MDLVDAAVRSIPSPFADGLGSVAIVVEDEPSPAQLASTGAAGLFGLYQGVPRTAYGAENAPVPNKITIFRGPLLRFYGADPAVLRAQIRHVVIHEIAHHFGISDERLVELGAY